MLRPDFKRTLRLVRHLLSWRVRRELRRRPGHFSIATRRSLRSLIVWPFTPLRHLRHFLQPHPAAAMILALAAIVGCVMGLLKFQLIVKPMKGDHVAVEISTLILAVVLQSGVILVFGDSSKILLPIVPGVERIAGAAIPYSNLVAVIASWAILIGLYYFGIFIILV